MPWYALRSRPNKEDALWREIRRRGHDAYYPHLCVQPINPRARWARPFFPGYLFVRADRNAVCPSLFSWVAYSAGLVSFGGEPAEVPDALIAAIRARVDEINAVGGKRSGSFELPLHPFEVGERVVIGNGPFRGFQAIFDGCLKGADRVRVLLLVLQPSHIKLDLSAADIIATNRH